MANRKTGRLIAAIIILVGAILLIASLVMPWYSFKESESSSFGSGSETLNFYPGMPSTNGTIQFTCTGAATCPSQTSYSAKNYNSTGTVAETGFFILITGIILGLIAAIFGVVSRGNARRANVAVPLAVVALILALIAPVLYAAVLPGAVGNDVKNHTGSGPWSSFYGSNSTTQAGISISTTWGPAIGWDLCIAAFVLLLVGVVLLARARREPPAPAATMAAPSTAPPAAPPTT